MIKLDDSALHRTFISHKLFLTLKLRITKENFGFNTRGSPATLGCNGLIDLAWLYRIGGAEDHAWSNSLIRGYRKVNAQAMDNVALIKN